MPIAEAHRVSRASSRRLRACPHAPPPPRHARIVTSAARPDDSLSAPRAAGAAPRVVSRRSRRARRASACTGSAARARSRGRRLDSPPPPQEPSSLTVRAPARSRPSSERRDDSNALQNDTTDRAAHGDGEPARELAAGAARSLVAGRAPPRARRRAHEPRSRRYLGGHRRRSHPRPRQDGAVPSHGAQLQRVRGPSRRRAEGLRHAAAPPRGGAAARRRCKNAVFHMYERFDGKGFPDKLVGKEIPLGARLLAVADTYADLTQNPRNPFRKVLGPAEAMNVLARSTRARSSTPALLDLFKALVLGEDMKAKLLANRYRALLIDPDPEESTVLELRMVEQGFDVKTARSVEAARKLARDGRRRVRSRRVRGRAARRRRPRVPLRGAQGALGTRHAVGRPHPEAGTHRSAARVRARRDGLRREARSGRRPRREAEGDARSVVDGKRGAKGVSGSLREMGLPDIVQVLFHGRKTGKLNVKRAGKLGEIHFLEGAIANAVVRRASPAPTRSTRWSASRKATSRSIPCFTPPKRADRRVGRSAAPRGHAPDRRRDLDHHAVQRST